MKPFGERPLIPPRGVLKLLLCVLILSQFAATPLDGNRIANQFCAPHLYATWYALTPGQRLAWSNWARHNKVLLETGPRQVSGQIAMLSVMRNRAIAGEPSRPDVAPGPVDWLDGALSLRDAGPFTENTGYVGFRVEQDLPAGTKWFVWATPPLNNTEAHPLQKLCFVKCMTLDAHSSGELLPDIGPDYQRVCGSWRGPVSDGEWPRDKFIWFQVHQYCDGQLGPGVVLKGRIQVEL